MEKKIDKHSTICPDCKRKIISNCWGCISGNTLICCRVDEEGDPEIIENVIWLKCK